MSNTYIISEIGINHNGDLDLAKELIKTSAKYYGNSFTYTLIEEEDMV